MQAIVLVGGEGTRLRPLTESIPKPALTLVDRPFLAYMIEWLAGHGVTEVVLACGFLPDALRDALTGEEERAGVAIRYVVEPEPLGTAGAIRHAAEALGDALDERFLALNGDVLTDLDLTALLREHERRSARSTLGLYRVEDAAAYGLVHRGEDGEVREFLEKTGRSEPGDVNAGMYVLENSVLDLIPAGQPVSIERDVFPRLVGQGLHGVVLDGYWMDIGTPERYLQATWDILERRVRTRVRPTGPGLHVAPGADVSPGATVGPRAVLAPGCRVGDGAEIVESVLLEGCVIAEGSRVSGSILAPGAEVAAGVSLEGAVAGKGERVTSPNA
ncbi:MAG TPA: NDP-sugar synthase [Solirubrobacterales bacterium]